MWLKLKHNHEPKFIYSLHNATNILEYIDGCSFEVLETTPDGDVCVISNPKYSESSGYFGCSGKILIPRQYLKLFFYEVPNPEDVALAIQYEEETTENGFNYNSIDNLHRASSKALFDLASSVKEIENAGYNGNIAQQIEALKKYQEVLSEIQKQIIDNRPMCS